MRYIVLDLDTGIDDAWGIFSLLNLKDENSEIVGITCVNGNTSVENVSKNTRYFLKIMKQDHIPVFTGAKRPLLLPEDNKLTEDYEFFHGRNGFGDYEVPDIGLPDVQKENAVVALNRLSEQYKEQLVLVCFAPLTNIALAIKTYPNFVNNVKEVFMMGGNYTAMGNTTMTAEFNVHTDPEAAQIVLTDFENKLTILPWEACYNSTIPFEWRYKIFENSSDPAIKLLNIVEKHITDKAKKLGYNRWISCDNMLAHIVVNQKLIKRSINAHAIVELQGKHTRGQIVIDHLKMRKDNVKIITEFDQELFKEMMEQLNNVKQY